MTPADGDQPKGRSRTVQGKKRNSENAFDIWLNRGLHQMFDDVASEPVPEDLLRLIEDDRGH